MEKRIGTALIVIEENDSVILVNKILSQHNTIIFGRQGIPIHALHLNIISVVLIGTTDEIGSLSGKLGKVTGVSVKTALIKDRSFTEINNSNLS